MFEIGGKINHVLLMSAYESGKRFGRSGTLPKTQLIGSYNKAFKLGLQEGREEREKK